MNNVVLEYNLDKIKDNAESLELKLKRSGLTEQDIPELYKIIDSVTNTLAELDNISLNDFEFDHF